MSARHTTFTVPGQPVPQPRARISTRGGFARAYVPAKHKIHTYRHAVSCAAKNAGIVVFDGAVAVGITFRFERPKSHKRLKDKAPEFPPADLDNLIKGVLDAMAGIAYHNDRQVVRFDRMDRLYAERGGTVITIGPAHQD